MIRSKRDEHDCFPLCYKDQTHLKVASVDRLEAESIEDEPDDVYNHHGGDVLAKLGVDRREGDELEEVADLDEDDSNDELHEEEGQGEIRSVQCLHSTRKERISSRRAYKKGSQCTHPFVARRCEKERRSTRSQPESTPFDCSVTQFSLASVCSPLPPRYLPDLPGETVATKSSRIDASRKPGRRSLVFLSCSRDGARTTTHARTICMYRQKMMISKAEGGVV
jgi:hypothetical protein